ncbi:MAG: metallophosphoesterase family protein [Armatimonadota bacterium]
MRFVQFADCHLDSSIGGALGLPDTKKAELQEDIRRAVARACALAADREADLVLIPGDLFDYECLKPDTVSFLLELFRGLSPIPVFIAPGNHDSLRPGNPYLPNSGVEWPENVRIFRTGEFETITINGAEWAVTGIAHAHRGITDRLVATYIPRTDAGVNVLLFHGSRDGYRPSDKENVLPFSDHELASQGFVYAAIGHYHSFGQITGGGRIVGAYSGCIQGRGLDETGEKVAIVGEIGADLRVTLERVEVSERRIVAVEVDLTGASGTESALARIENAIAGSGARPQDIVSLQLRGSWAGQVDLDVTALERSAGYFHLRICKSGLRPEYDLEALASESAAAPLRSAFVRKMLDLRNAARDPEEAAVITDAVYYGLAALDGRSPEPRDVD